MPGPLCPGGGAVLSTGHKDSRLQCCAKVTAAGGGLSLTALHFSHMQTHQSEPPPPPPMVPRPSQSSSKLARSTLHPVIITLPNRRHICVARPPRQSEAAVQFPLLLWLSAPPPPPLPSLSTVHPGTVLLPAQ